MKNYQLLDGCVYDFVQNMKFPVQVHGEPYNEYLALVHTQELLSVGATESVMRKGANHKWSFLLGKEIAEI